MPVPHCPLSKEFITSNLNLPSFSLKPSPPCPITIRQCKRRSWSSDTKSKIILQKYEAVRPGRQDGETTHIPSLQLLLTISPWAHKQPCLPMGLGWTAFSSGFCLMPVSDTSAAGQTPSLLQGRYEGAPPWRHSRSGWTGLWAPWSSCRCPCSLQGRWTRWPF